MDLKINVKKKELGKVKYEDFPAFQYFFHEMGFDIDLDSSNQSVHLTSALEKRKILITSEENVIPYSFRKHDQERLVLKQIQSFLEASGANALLKKQQMEGNTEADLYLKFALLEVPNIKEPLLELSHSSTSVYQKLVEVIKSECKKSCINFKLNPVSSNYEPASLNIKILTPVTPDDDFWGRYGEIYALVITSGIFARFIENSPFSLIPVENLLCFFSKNTFSYSPEKPVHRGDLKVTNENSELKETYENTIKENKTFAAEVYFNYHLLIEDKEDSKKVQFLGGLSIKNIGTKVLRNPVICIRSKPSKNIKITGQIVPHAFAQTKGVLSQEGAKGWRYLNENWLEEFEEKGELWICPIQSLDILPGQTETFSNLQITLLNLEEKTIRVDSSVFFPKDDLEFKSNNQISLSLLD